MSSQSPSTPEEFVVQYDKLDVSENVKSEDINQSDHDVSETLDCDGTDLKDQGYSMFNSDEKESATPSSETIDSDSDAEITGIYQCSQTRKRRAMPKKSNAKRAKIVGDLSKEEEYTILNDGILTDQSIDMVQKMLSDKIPDLDGLHDTVVGPSNAFPIVKTYKKYVQILYTDRLHWVCTANLDKSRSDNSSSLLYDSMNSGRVVRQVAEQIASFSNCRNPELQIQIQGVQQQNNSIDCGLFAAAFATSLAFGQDPSKVQYDAAKLRSHLLKCLKNKEMEPFPTIDSKEQYLKCPFRTATVELFCSCQCPTDVLHGKISKWLNAPNVALGSTEDVRISLTGSLGLPLQIKNGFAAVVRIDIVPDPSVTINWSQSMPDVS